MVDHDSRCVPDHQNSFTVHGRTCEGTTRSVSQLPTHLATSKYFRITLPPLNMVCESNLTLNINYPVERPRRPFAIYASSLRDVRIVHRKRDEGDSYSNNCLEDRRRRRRPSKSGKPPWPKGKGPKGPPPLYPPKSKGP